MLDEKVMDDLPHDVKSVSPRLVHQYPDTTLEGTIQIIADQELDLREFRC